MPGMLLKSIVLLTVMAMGCQHAKPKTEESESTQHQNETTMHNFISIVEIPASDLARAVSFYESILGIAIEKMEMDGNQMGVIPNEAGTVNVVIVKGPDYKPTSDGAVLYLNAGDDLQPALDKVAQNGGNVIVPKTMISPEMGYFAMFIDTEGNKLGLHSGK